MQEVLRETSLLLALLNPFLLVVYLTDVFERLDRRTLRRVLTRAGLIASATFVLFALLGDAVFAGIVRADFSAFQIFGGLVFVLIGLQFMFRGPKSVEMLRGESAHIAGGVAMPVLIGPGTISASVVIGKRLEPMSAAVAVILAVSLSLTIIVLLKTLHDYVRSRHEALVDRYIEIAGKVTALYVGTIAVHMILQGVGAWMVTL